MTRDADSSRPWFLIQGADAADVADVAGAADDGPVLTDNGSGAPLPLPRLAAGGSPEPDERHPDEPRTLPDDERILSILGNGPLLPFDYCYLRGQREGLVPVVQTQLVKRNPRLVKVDRTPLGIDPNADLFRCFTMHGNPNEPVTVYTSYERDICTGVVSGYFHVPEIKRHLYLHYQRKNWLGRNALTGAAEEWLEAYDQALRFLLRRMRALGTRERATLVSDWADWVHPALRCADRDAGVMTVENETTILASHMSRQLHAARRWFWEATGDFTFLSIISRPAFCAFAWMKQVQFPRMTRADVELGRSERVGLFQPWLLVPGIIALVVGMLILGYGLNQFALRDLVAGSFQASYLAPAVLGGVPMLAGIVLLLANLAFWLMYTSGSERLLALVPGRWTRGRPKNVGYLR